MEYGIGLDADAGVAIAQIVEIIVDRLQRRDDGHVFARGVGRKKSRENAGAGDVIGFSVDAGEGFRAQLRIGNRLRAFADGFELRPKAGRCGS